eukprot:3137908-Pyramimonas_sp.AAC.1
MRSPDGLQHHMGEGRGWGVLRRGPEVHRLPEEGLHRSNAQPAAVIRSIGAGSRALQVVFAQAPRRAFGRGAGRSIPTVPSRERICGLLDTNRG